MAKSKHFKTLAYSDSGDELIFDRVGFKEVFDGKAKEINKSNGKQCGGQKILLEEIAKYLYPNCNVNIESNAKSIKNWLYGNNGPSALEDVRKMEAFFECELLMPRPINNASNKGDLSSMNNCEVTVAERSAARELYQLMTDLIRVHQKAMYCFWYADFPVHNNTKWAQYVPNDYPVLPDIQYQIRKISFDLPQEVRDDTLRLAEELYCYPSFPEEKDEGVPYPFMDCEYDDFIIFLRKKSKDELKWENSGEVMDEWFEFSNEQTENFYNTLDEIFYAYRR